MGRPGTAGAARLRRAGLQGGGSSAPKARGRRRPENRLAHAVRKDDRPSFGDAAIRESVESVESVDQLFILKSSELCFADTP